MSQNTYDPDDLEAVEGWREVYDFLYEDAWGEEVGEDFTGWDSAYDGSPIPIEEMREWRAATVDAVLALNPRRVLEIGVGDGHILSRVAPQVERYVGTDFSAVAIDSFRHQLQTHPQLAAKVGLHALAAHETGCLEQSFDTIVINSVVQYFPGLDYLRTAVAEAMARLEPGGALYIGDVRNLRTTRALATAVARNRLDDDITPDGVSEILRTDRELAVDPAWWTGLGHPADVRLRRGRAHNELSRHRYDVVLRRLPSTVLSLADAPQRTWDGDLGALTTDLTGRESLRLTGVPNSRLAAEVTDDRAVHEEPQTDLRDAVDPERFHEIGSVTGHHVAVTWSPDDIGHVDVVFVDPHPHNPPTLASAWTDLLRRTS